MKKILVMIFFIGLSINTFAETMSSENFDAMAKDLKDDFNASTKLSRVKAESESYDFTCKQVAQILKEGFAFDTVNRYTALEYMAPKIVDIKNKQLILNEFSNAYDTIGKQKAIKLLSKINSKSKDEESDTGTSSSKSKLSGNVTIKVVTSGCNTKDTFLPDDQVFFGFDVGKKVAATSYSLWISTCKNSNHQSCFTPFAKKEFDILPDWTGTITANPIKMKDVLSLEETVSVPKSKYYNFAIIIKNKVVAEKMIKYINECE